MVLLLRLRLATQLCRWTRFNLWFSKGFACCAGSAAGAVGSVAGATGAGSAAGAAGGGSRDDKDRKHMA